MIQETNAEDKYATWFKFCFRQTTNKTVLDSWIDSPWIQTLARALYSLISSLFICTASAITNIFWIDTRKISSIISSFTQWSNVMNNIWWGVNGYTIGEPNVSSRYVEFPCLPLGAEWHSIPGIWKPYLFGNLVSIQYGAAALPYCYGKLAAYDIFISVYQDEEICSIIIKPFWPFAVELSTWAYVKRGMFAHVWRFEGDVAGVQCWRAHDNYWFDSLSNP